MNLTGKRTGVVVSAVDSNEAPSIIEDLERRGVPAAWMASWSAGGADSLSLFAVAAARTQKIMLGTAVTQTFPRHPVAVAQLVQARLSVVMPCDPRLAADPATPVHSAQ